MLNTPAYIQQHIVAIQQLGQTLRGASCVLVIPHRKPDGDAIGSATALFQACDAWGVPADAFCVDAVPPYLQFLPYRHRILTDRAKLASRYDVIITVDAEVKVAGVSDLVTEIPHITLCTIDHHATTTGSGVDLAIVTSDASSTCELMFYMFQIWEVRLTPDLATSLLCGLVTDTGSFANPGVTPAAFTAAAALIRHGARWHEVTANVTRMRQLAVWRLWGLALQRLRAVSAYNMAVTFVRLVDLQTAGLEAADSTANFLGAYCQVPTIMVIREQVDGTLKGSLRTTDDTVDVATLAATLGGGGHRKASGFVLPGYLVEGEDGAVSVAGPVSPQLVALQSILTNSAIG
jgi:phosphoesterase RecJ-like protein